MNKVKVERLNPDTTPINDTHVVTITRMGDYTEVKYNSNPNRKQNVRKLNNDQYEILKTGEIKEYDHTHNKRIDSIISLLRTFDKMRKLLYTNCTEIPASHMLWCTLTYAENMTDATKLYDDFRKFNQRFKRYCDKKFNLKYEYFVVAEPQQRGAWHMHVIYIFGRKAPFIPNEKLCEIWGKGFTKVKAVKEGDNVADYLIAYMTDLDIDDSEKKDYSPESLKDGQSKAIVKGGRLYLYPKSMRIMRHSRGIKYPVEYKEKFKYTKENLKSMQQELIYKTSSQIEVMDESGKKTYSTVIVKETYRKEKK